MNSMEQHGWVAEEDSITYYRNLHDSKLLVLFGTEEENDNALYDLMKSGSLHANQYIILHDSDTGEDEAVRWDAELQNYVGIFIPIK